MDNWEFKERVISCLENTAMIWKLPIMKERLDGARTFVVSLLAVLPEVGISQAESLADAAVARGRERQEISPAEADRLYEEAPADPISDSEIERLVAVTTKICIGCGGRGGWIDGDEGQFVSCGCEVGLRMTAHQRS
jgi:hypothetical protein